MCLFALLIVLESCLDYIFLEANSQLCAVAALDVDVKVTGDDDSVSDDASEAARDPFDIGDVVLPSKFHPSDHLPIRAVVHYQHTEKT